MLSQYSKKVKQWILVNKSDIFLSLIILLVGLGSFGLGRLSVLWPKKEPIRISENYGILNSDKNSSSQTAAINQISNYQGKYVASKSGKNYHYPWCSGALRIKDVNKIWFQTKEEAEKAGYKPAGNCEGL